MAKGNIESGVFDTFEYLLESIFLMDKLHTMPVHICYLILFPAFRRKQISTYIRSMNIILDRKNTGNYFFYWNKDRSSSENKRWTNAKKFKKKIARIPPPKEDEDDNGEEMQSRDGRQFSYSSL